MNDIRHSADALRRFAADLLIHSGMPGERARDMAEILVDGDLAGHETHGLNLLPTYLEHIGQGHLHCQGEYTVVAERPAVATWDGHQLPGAWLVLQAMASAIERARVYGTGTVTIRRSHHIGSLSAYLRRATEQGFLMLLFSSAPGGGSVAPFGGLKPLFSPSPIAMGCPTEGDPILVDVSTSITTNNRINRLRQQGGRLPGPWLLDGQGNASDDPAVLASPHAGSLLPLGGLDAGHKGYGLALMVEALTAGLTDQGRHQPAARFSNTVWLQVLDPEAFGGLAALKGQMQRISDACHDTPPRPGVERVVLPGERAERERRQQLDSGVRLAPGIMEALRPHADRLGVPMPSPAS